MEKVINQLGQTVQIKATKFGDAHVTIGNTSKYQYLPYDPIFKDSEFNPVLLADGSIIPYYKYNGQPVK